MIIAFTGAGISKASGIPTFNDRPGIRDKLVRSYAKAHPEEYRQTIADFIQSIEGKVPNDAHYALAEYEIPVMTMNVDTLHEQAGTKNIVKMHGSLPRQDQLSYCDRLYNTPVLYEDPAPNYQTAYDWIWLMEPGDILLIIGASNYTNVSFDLRVKAMGQGVSVEEIQENADTAVREFLEKNFDKIETFEQFMERKNDRKWLE